MEKRSTRKTGFVIGGAILFVALVVIIVIQLMDSGPTFDVRGDAPEFELTNYTGEQASIASTNGNVRLVYFFFSHCPNVCQPTTYMLSQVQKKLQDDGYLGNKAQLISITFDPERDTEQRLQEYSAKFNADREGWLFLRGDQDDTIALAKEYGVFVQKLEGGDFAHTNAVFLIDQIGQIRKVYLSSDLDLDHADNIAKDVIALSKQQ